MNFFQKTLNWLVPSSPTDALTRILFAWRLWLVGAVLGALVAGMAYAIAPPPYRAQATIVVDNNLEEAWQYFPDRQLFYFLERESRKLEAVAWDDQTLEQVAAQVGDTTPEELRTNSLKISHPAEGGWRFLAEDTDKARAKQIAAAWAEAFISEARAGVEVSDELEDARAELRQLLSAGKPDLDAVEVVTSEIAQLTEATAGISPYIELDLNQTKGIPAARTVSTGIYLLAGSLVGALLLGLMALFILKPEDQDDTGV
ncbi:MAG: hypothetical protein JXB38_00390 [Anaerolineales bacterium]|nr:hypothetical protein [Anaerolineales bacterium]